MIELVGPCELVVFAVVDSNRNIEKDAIFVGVPDIKCLFHRIAFAILVDRVGHQVVDRVKIEVIAVFTGPEG